MDEETTLNEVGKIYHRPRGSYQTLSMGDGYQVKILTVNSGGRLSLQKHFKRAEHWVVVEGKPTVTVNDNVNELSVNQSAFIPPEATHRIENFTDKPAALIEVQVGAYLGEDDIVRLDDVYGRNQ